MGRSWDQSERKRRERERGREGKRGKEGKGEAGRELCNNLLSDECRVMRKGSISASHEGLGWPDGAAGRATSPSMAWFKTLVLRDSGSDEAGHQKSCGGESPGPLPQAAEGEQQGGPAGCWPWRFSASAPGLSSQQLPVSPTVSAGCRGRRSKICESSPPSLRGQISSTPRSI